jgi:hypothetical protein
VILASRGLVGVRRPRGALRAIRAFIHGLAAFVVLLHGASLEAQEAADPIAVDAVVEEGGFGIVGERPDRRRVIGGLWALHPFEPQFPEMDWTRGFGVQFSQWFAATFVNSYDGRSFIFGLERYWLRGRRGVIDAGVGYRLGVLTGYDERLIPLAGYVPILPFGGVLGWADVGPIGVDMFYIFRALTLEGSVRF